MTEEKVISFKNIELDKLPGVSPKMVEYIEYGRRLETYYERIRRKCEALTAENEMLKAGCSSNSFKFITAHTEQQYEDYLKYKDDVDNREAELRAQYEDALKAGNFALHFKALDDIVSREHQRYAIQVNKENDERKSD